MEVICFQQDTQKNLPKAFKFSVRIPSSYSQTERHTLVTAFFEAVLNLKLMELTTVC